MAQPIETAPKDREILLFSPGETHCRLAGGKFKRNRVWITGYWKEAEGGSPARFIEKCSDDHRSESISSSGVEYTHWMDLPEFP